MQYTIEQASAVGGMIRTAWKVQKRRQNDTSAMETADD